MNHPSILLALVGLTGAAGAGYAQVSFGVPTAAATEKAPIWMAAADFNGDGKPDLAVANAGSQNVAISLGNGDGTFQAPVEYETPNCAPNYLAAGDFNRDGKTDLLVLCVLGSQILVLPGKGDGTFGSPIQTNFTVATVAGEDLLVLQPAVADFNGDGIPDIALLAGTATETGTKNGKLTNPVDYLLLGKGDGTFQAPQAIAAFAGRPAISLAAADFNGDGKADLAALVLEKSGDTTVINLTIAEGHGDGTFEVTASYPVFSGFDLTVADFNGDGVPDLLISGFSFPGTAKIKEANGGLQVYLGQGDGTFKLGGSVALDSGSFLAEVTAADLRGIGHMDVIATEWMDITGSHQAAELSEVTGAVVWLAGNGDGTFQSPVNLAPASTQIPVAIASADFNGDGRADVAFTSLSVAGLTTALPETGNLGESATEIVSLFPAGLASVMANTTPPSTFSDANAASFARGAMAEDSIVAAFGGGLASTTAQPPALTTSLGGVTVTVKDATGSARQAELFYVSPTQVNYAIPAGTAAGQAAITIANGASQVTVNQQIVPVLPGLFSVAGIAAANVETFQGSTMTGVALAFQVSGSGAITPQPIDVTAGQVYLLMYGTGIRHAASVTADIGAMKGLPVAYYGAQGAYVGEDQINIVLPAALAGAGLVNVTLNADGQVSNAVQIQIR